MLSWIIHSDIKGNWVMVGIYPQCQNTYMMLTVVPSTHTSTLGMDLGLFVW